MQLIGRYVFENFEVGDEIKSKMDLIEKSKLSYDEFKKYDYAKTKFLQERFNQNLSEKQKNIILNKHIHEVLTALNTILESNNQLSSFFQFIANLENFKNDPTPEKIEGIKTDIKTLRELNLNPEQLEFLSQVEQLDFEEVLTSSKRMKQ